MNTTEPKKAWTAPELEIISKDVIKTGTDPYYAEGVPTPSSLAYGDS